MANRYLVAGGNGQWNSTSNWSATSGGASGASFPVAADAVIFDAASANANITVDVTTNCTSITASNYTGTLTVNATLFCTGTYGGFTFSTGMTCAGNGTIGVSGAPATINTNGVNIPGTLGIFNNGTVITTTGTTTVGTLSILGTSASIVLTGGTINTNSLVSTTVTNGILSGTTKIVLTGTGTVSFPAGWTGGISNNVDINSTSTTFVGNFRYGNGTFSYIAGTVDASASTLVLVGSCTLNLPSISWLSASITTTSTITLASNLNITGTLFFLSNVSTVTLVGAFVVNTGTLDLQGSSGTRTLTGGTINTNSLVSTTLTSGLFIGTTKIVLTGTGIVSFPVTWTGSIANNIDINSTNTTFIGNFRYITGTLSYIAGTVDTSAGTLVLAGSCTLNTANMSWRSVSIILATTTVTLTSNLNITETLFTSALGTATTTFSGSFVVNTGTLNIQGTTTTLVLNGGTINTNSLVSTTVTSKIISGTTKIVLTGTGIVDFPVTWTGSIANSIDINSTNTTFIGNFGYITGTLRYIAGTVDASASTLILRGACTINTSGMDWGNVTVGVALTLTLTSAFTCSGTFSIPAVVFTVSGAGFWTRVGNLTFTATSTTLTLPNNLTVTGTLTPGTGTTTINGNSLLISSLNARGTTTGTATIVFNGTGTWSGTGILTNNTTINTTGTLTVGDNTNTAKFATRTLTYTAGTVDSSVGGLQCTSACTLNCSGMTWAKILLTGTITLSSVLNATHTRITGTTTFVNANRFTQTDILSLEGAGTFTLINNITVISNIVCIGIGGNFTMNGFQLICNGGITTTGTGGALTGTTTILLNGTGTYTSPNVSDTIVITNNTTINTAGTITFAGYPSRLSGTLTYTAGTVITAGSELRCNNGTILNTAGISWDNISFIGTITFTSNLTVTGTAKIVGGTSFVGLNRFTQVPVLELVNAAGLNLINNITVTDTFKSSNNGSAQSMNGFQLICNGGITTTGTGSVSGTTTILLNGTGTWTSNSSNILVTSNAIRNNTTINTAGTITFVDKVSFNTGTLTYVAGTLVTDGGILACNASTTLNTPGVNWHTVLLSGTITLSTVLNVTNTTILSGFVTFVGVNRFTQTGNLKLVNGVDLRMINDITVLENIITLPGDTTEHYLDVVNSGAFEIYTSGFDIQGDPDIGIQSLFFDKIIVNGTGTWQGKVWLFGDLIINTAGTLTVVGDVYARNGSITYQAGTVVTTGSTLKCNYGVTLDTNGLLWDNVTIGEFYQGDECTLNSALNVTGTLYLYIADTFGTELELKGTAGFIANNLNIVQDGRVNAYGSTLPNKLKLQSGVTYQILDNFTATDNAGRHRLLIYSSTPEQKAILTLAPTAIQRLAFVSATDIDSSLGQKVWSYDAVITRTDNWQDLSLIVADLNAGTGTTSAETSHTWVA